MKHHGDHARVYLAQARNFRQHPSFNAKSLKWQPIKAALITTPAPSNGRVFD